MTDLREITTNTVESSPGFWETPGRSRVSYPDSGHDLYAKIEELSFWFLHRNACILSAVTGVSPKKPLIDIGGGNGFVAKCLTEAGWNTVVLEPGYSGARKAYDRGLRPVIVGDFDSVGFLDGVIPAVGIFDVLEHINDDADFLIGVRRKMHADGYMFVTVPAFGILWSEEDVIAGHFRRYSLSTITNLVEKVGFQVIYGTYFFSFLPIPIFILRAIPGFLGFKATQELNEYHGKHIFKGKFAGWLIGCFCSVEKFFISKHFKIPFGSSLLIIAKNTAGGPGCD